MLCMAPTGDINGTPMVDNVRSRPGSNSLKESLAESSVQRKRWKNKYAKIKEWRQRKGKKSSDENNNNAGSIHDATKRSRRVEKDTMEATVVAYQNPRFVRVQRGLLVYTERPPHEWESSSSRFYCLFQSRRRHDNASFSLTRSPINLNLFRDFVNGGPSHRLRTNLSNIPSNL